jgi:hypothetical protein
VSIAEFISTAPHRKAIQRLPAATLLKFPAVEPGQLWLIEALADGTPSVPARHAVDGANVVIYDRALAETLSGALPLGTYAEPAPVADGLGNTSASRCVRFTGDGWSVARLVPARLPQRARARRVRGLIDALAAAKAPSDLAVQVFAEAGGGICEQEETRLDRLAHLVATHPRNTRLTIVIAARRGDAARVQAVAGNGLAG